MIDKMIFILLPTERPGHSAQKSPAYPSQMSAALLDGDCRHYLTLERSLGAFLQK